MLPQRRHSVRDVAGRAQPHGFGAEGGRRRGRALISQPVAHNRIGQQVQQLPRLGRRSLSRLGLARPDCRR